jgi:hypothetical protein
LVRQLSGVHRSAIGSTPEQKPPLITANEGRYIHSLPGRYQLQFKPARQAFATKAEFAFVESVREGPGKWRWPRLRSTTVTSRLMAVVTRRTVQPATQKPRALGG